MALDTGREYLRARHPVHRIAAMRIEASRRRKRWFGAAALGVVALMAGARGRGDLAADVSRLAQRLSLLPEPTCSDLPEHYGRAVRALGTSWEGPSVRAFDRARASCERQAASMASRAGAEACDGAARTFAQALELRRAAGSSAATAPSPGSTIGMSAAGILGGDDPTTLQASAGDMVARCSS